VRDWLTMLTERSITVIDLMALLVIAAGTVQASVTAVPALFGRSSDARRRALWLRYAHTLVAGLTLQLAADIIETATTESWAAVGKIGAIAVIRTFLNYFLERDLTDVHEREQTVSR